MTLARETVDMFHYLILTFVLWIHIVDSVDFIPGMNEQNAEKVCENAVAYVARNKPASTSKSPFKIETNMTKYIPGQAMTGRFLTFLVFYSV